jgi:HEPN domain-containing protein
MAYYILLYMMTDEQKYEYWLDIAEYDLATASSLHESGRWLYVLVMCQQAVEKLIKGLYTLYVDDNVPRIHDITKLFKCFDGRLSISVPDERFAFFNELSQYYLNNRYPEFISKLSSQISEAEAHSILTKTEEAFSWLLTLKP